MGIREGIVRALVVSGAALSAGCHVYRPVETASLGTAVRVHVPVTSALASPNAPQQTAAVEGRLLAWGDSIVLESTNVVLLGAYRELTRVDTVRLGHGQVSLVEIQEFSRPRTLVLTAVMVGGIGLLAATAMGLVGGEQGGGKPGDGTITTGQRTPPGLTIPILRFGGG